MIYIPMPISIVGGEQIEHSLPLKKGDLVCLFGGEFGNFVAGYSNFVELNIGNGEWIMADVSEIDVETTIMLM